MSGLDYGTQNSEHPEAAAPSPAPSNGSVAPLVNTEGDIALQGWSKEETALIEDYWSKINAGATRNSSPKHVNYTNMKTAMHALEIFDDETPYSTSWHWQTRVLVNDRLRPFELRDWAQEVDVKMRDALPDEENPALETLQLLRQVIINYMYLSGHMLELPTEQIMLAIQSAKHSVNTAFEGVAGWRA